MTKFLTFTIGAIAALLASAAPSAHAGEPGDALDAGDVRNAVESSQRRVSVQEAELNELSLRGQLMDKQDELARRQGVAQLPTLVGISDGKGGAMAEFFDGYSVRTVRVGAEVVPGWRVVAVGPSGVELDGGSPRRRHSLTVGSSNASR